MPDYTKKAGRKIQHFAKGGKVEDWGSEVFPGGSLDEPTRNGRSAKENLKSDLELNERTGGALAKNYGRRAQDIADDERVTGKRK